MTSLDQLIADARKTVRCLALELPGPVWDDASARIYKALDAVAATQWVPVADLPGELDGEFLYVLLPDRTVTQAMRVEFFTDEINGRAWGYYTDVDGYERLPVQPTHFAHPPLAPAQ